MGCRYLITGLFLSWTTLSHAEALDFIDPLTIYSTHAVASAAPAANAKKQFIHLDSSGRRLIAVSNTTVAVTWEDNRTGQPAIYVAYLLPGAKQFSRARRVSAEAPAYEPVITPLPENRFLVAWEESDRVWLRVISPEGNGKIQSLAKSLSRQVNVSSLASGVGAAVWAMTQDQQKRDFYIYYAGLRISGLDVEITKPILVDNSKDRQTQLYPVLSLTSQGRIVVWEDRRQGATRMFSAYAPLQAAFDSYRLLNQFAGSPNPKFGHGSGAMRAALASDEQALVAVTWMDKRNWRSGYDVFADISRDGGKTFTGNEKVQDMFANDIPQWHASIALRPKDKLIVVAWDDTRNDTPDVFYSLRENDAWSDDYELPGATGAADQSHPSIVFDQQGRLHAVWLESTKQGVSLMYTRSQ